MVFFPDQFLEQALLQHNTCTSTKKEAEQEKEKKMVKTFPQKIYLPKPD